MRRDDLHTMVRLICCITGMLLVLLGSELHAQDKPVFDPWELGPFIEGDEVPPEDMVILLRISSVAPAGSSYAEAIERYMWEARRLTNGLIEGKLYPGGLMGDEADSIRKMRMKQIHSVACTNMGLTMMTPELCVLELPFLFDYEPDLHYNGKYTEIDYILEELRPTMERISEERGVVLASIGESCLDAIASQVPVRSVEDFKKLRMWLFRGDRIRPEVNKVFGFGKVISAELYDVSTMLSTGMLDATYMAWYPAVILQWWPHLKYAMDYPVYGYESASGHYDKEVIERLKAFGDKWGPRYGLKDGQDLVNRIIWSMFRTGHDLRYQTRLCEAEARDELIRRGAIELVHFPEEELEKLRQRVLPLYDRLADKLYPRWLLDEILKYREEYRELKKAGKLTREWYEARRRSKWGDIETLCKEAYKDGATFRGEGYSFHDPNPYH